MVWGPATLVDMRTEKPAASEEQPHTSCLQRTDCTVAPRQETHHVGYLGKQKIHWIQN